MPIASTVQSYLSSKNLDGSEFLFPSHNDPARPMTAHELSATWQIWLLKAKLRDRKFSLHHLQLSLSLSLSLSLDESEIQRKLGHTSHATTAAYIKGVKRK
ncbi:tyrosine-type recombinase/integrase [Pseudomonas salomonii]|uniref:Tyrosine-type recombinase/integrase n=1 Tax=Pseudomonas salomonii TaxID=191391 RepID=A0A7Y8G9S7_9PSED|nr:tyrosine-type recombinase/integrase [Pseudomonas salomonii]